MVDDHKFSIRRVVAYRHPEPEHSEADYGPMGYGRTYGLILEVMLSGEENPHWEYIIRNTLTGEVRQVPESDIFHGADRGYLDLYRRDSIFLSEEASAPEDSEEGRSKYWRRALKKFVQMGIPRLIEQEENLARARKEGMDLNLAAGDYVKLRGDLRPGMEHVHNLYAKVLDVHPPDVQSIEIGAPGRGLQPGTYKVQNAYRVLLDDGTEADVYDIEVKVTYTRNGRQTVLNWRAAAFLAEAFGDEPPYHPDLEYLNGHIFSRAELEGKPAEELADLLTEILYAKGQILWEELDQKRQALAQSPQAYLIDQILANSRFDMAKNRPLTEDEIQRSRLDEDRLRGLLE